MSSVKPNDGCDEVYSAEECACELVVTRCYPSEVFDCVEETLNEIALPIEGVISISGFFPVGF